MRAHRKGAHPGEKRMEFWFGIATYVTIFVILLLVLGIAVQRRATAKRRYIGAALSWRKEGFTRVCRSPAGAVLWDNRPANVLLLAREGHERSERVPYANLSGYALYDDSLLLAQGGPGREQERIAPPCTHHKSNGLRIHFTFVAGGSTDFLLTTDSIRRDSREYKDVLENAEGFLALLEEATHLS